MKRVLALALTTLLFPSCDNENSEDARSELERESNTDVALNTDGLRSQKHACPTDPSLLSQRLQESVRVSGILTHQEVLQGFADKHQGIRASGTPGYDASVRYVMERLQRAGFKTSKQPFEFPFFMETSPPVFELTAPAPVVFKKGTEFVTMEFAPTGNVTGEIQHVAALGCDAADFADFQAGHVALIKRGTCSFFQKALNAQTAGAASAIVVNVEDKIDFTPTLGEEAFNSETPVTIPVVFVKSSVGSQLTAASTTHTATATVREIRTTYNVIADTRGGSNENIIVVGAHLDSVLEGPGINDNGSGSSTILEIALQLAKDFDVNDHHSRLRNKVRFAFWGAEENGLYGSYFHVDGLTDAARAHIAANLNFDMIASPNFVRFVYDGDGSAFESAGPAGSDAIEKLFVNYFTARKLPSAPTEFDGRSDYAAFIDYGIPAGGLFTGAEGVKTAEEALTYGGHTGEAYDPCYHQACDTIYNYSPEAFDQMSNAASHAVAILAASDLSIVLGPRQPSPQLRARQGMNISKPRANHVRH